jgi:hypothetical protein
MGVAGNEDRTSCYAGNIVRSFLSPCRSTTLRSTQPGQESTRDGLRPTMEQTLRQDRPQASHIDRGCPVHGASPDLPAAGPSLSKQQRWGLEIRPGRNR